MDSASSGLGGHGVELAVGKKALSLLVAFTVVFLTAFLPSVSLLLGGAQTCPIRTGCPIAYGSMTYVLFHFGGLLEYQAGTTRYSFCLTRTTCVLILVV